MNQEFIELMKIQQKKMERVQWIKKELIFLQDLIKILMERSEYLAHRTAEELDLFISVHESLAEVFNDYMEELIKDSDELLNSFLKCE